MAFLRDSEVLLCACSQINKAVWLERRESMAELGQVSVPPDFVTSTAVTVTLLVSPLTTSTRGEGLVVTQANLKP